MASTGDLEKETHSDSTPDVDYHAYDRMGRVTWLTDGLGGQRLLYYDGNSGLSVSAEDLPNTFYGGNYDIAYSYEDGAGSTLEGRYKGLTYAGKSWTFTYDAASGRLATVGGSYASGTRTMNYGYTAGRLTSVAGSAHENVREYDAWTGWLSKVDFTWNSASRARFQEIGRSWHGQADTAKLKYDGGTSLAAKYDSNNTSDINLSWTYVLTSKLAVVFSTSTVVVGF